MTIGIRLILGEYVTTMVEEKQIRSSNFICFSKTVFRILSAIILVLIFVGWCIFHITRNETQHLVFSGQRWFFLPCLAVFLLALAFCAEWIQQLRPRLLFLAGSLLWLAFAAFVLLHITPEFRADQEIVFQCAQQFLSGDYSALFPSCQNWSREITGYMFIYPQNLGLAAFESGLLSIWNSRYMLYFVWFFFSLCNQFLLWKIVSLVSGESRLTENYTLILGFLFLPNFFMFLVIYGDVPGMTFLLLSFYCLLKSLKSSRSVLHTAISLLCISIAVILRKSILIACIAVSILLILKALKSKKMHFVLYAAGYILIPLLCSRMVLSVFESLCGHNIIGMPPILWTAMGLQDGSRAPGWYNAWPTKIFRGCNLDPVLSTKKALDYISVRSREFFCQPYTALRFFGQKFISTYNEPTYLTFVYSYGLNSKFAESHVSSDFLLSLFANGTAGNFYAFSGGLLSAVLTLLSLIRLFQKHKPDTLVFYLPYLFLIGNTLFYLLFWETKSRFIWPSIVLLIPCASAALEELVIRAKEKKRKTV